MNNNNKFKITNIHTYIIEFYLANARRLHSHIENGQRLSMTPCDGQGRHSELYKQPENTQRNKTATHPNPNSHTMQPTRNKCTRLLRFVDKTNEYFGLLGQKIWSVKQTLLDR